jgi:AcrR family transcriptional regulator
MSRPRPAPLVVPAAGSLKLQLARSDIVHAAIEVFSSRSAESTTVEDLLEAAGVARRTFYKHFRSKDDVLAAVYELVTRELSAAIESRRDESDDPTTSLRSTLDVYLGFHADNHRILRVLIEQGTRSESGVAPLRRRFRADLVRQLSTACELATGLRVDAYVFVGLISAIEGISQELLAQPSAPASADVERARRAMHGLLEAVFRSVRQLPHA